MTDMNQVAIVVFFLIGVGCGVQLPFIIKNLKSKKPNYITSKEEAKK